MTADSGATLLRPPGAPRELVRLVAGLPAEQLGQRPLVWTEHVQNAGVQTTDPL